MEIVNKKINDLIPYVNNTRTHSDEQVSQICSSIREFGFTNPILLDEKDGIIAGHGRLMAAKKLNMEEVPTITLKGLTETQIKAYIIADNKLALNAGWDEDLLQLELISLDEMGFDYSKLGFDFDFNMEDVDEDFEPDLPTGDREPIRNMTFTVSDEQHEIIEECLKLAKEFPLQDPAGINENSNGNALYYICEVFKNNVS